MRNFLLLAFVNLLWALQFPATKIASGEMGPMTVTVFALFLSMLILIPLMLDERRRNTRVRLTPGRSALYLAMLGIMGSLVAQLFLNWGTERSLASNASVLNLAVPGLMAVLAAVLLGERMTWVRWAAFVLSVAGVVMVSEVDFKEASLLENRYLLGNGLIFLSCCGSAFYNVFSKRLLEWFGPAELLVASFAVSVVVLLPVALTYEPGMWQRLAAASWQSWVCLIAIAALSLSLSMVLFFRVLANIEATQASLSIYLLPVFGVALSGLALKERITPSLLLGGLLVCIGAWLVTVYENRMETSNELPN
jgi:drug/metabolite transporter (DMT)-like permease